MKIGYVDPFAAAWNRMTKILFKKFDLGKWMVLGFSAFLAALTEWNAGFSNPGLGQWNKFINPGKFLDYPATAWDWIVSNPTWSTVIIVGIILLFSVFIVLLWLSSRGKFIFLDNVIQNRAIIAKPWNEFRHLGNSLFLWRLCFWLICMIIFIPLIVYGYSSIHDSYYQEGLTGMFSTLAAYAAIFFFLLIIVLYIGTYLTDFIVPVMYKHNLTAMKAWSRFSGIFRERFLHFILYGIVRLLMVIIAGIAIALGGLLTCCIGYILLVIPYIGSVVTLPVSVTFRTFSLEYLGQFGDDYRLFPAEGKPENINA